MRNETLLDKLDKATTRIAEFAMDNGYPVKISTATTVVGHLTVKKVSDNCYNVVSAAGVILYRNIYVFDVALIVAQRYNSKDLKTIETVLTLEDEFAKYRTDMIHYLRCVKHATLVNDWQRVSILEDKFQLAEAFARVARNKILRFKRVK